LLAVASGTALLAACTNGGGGQARAPSTTLPAATTTASPRFNVDGTLTIGLLLPTSGDAAGLAAPMIRGAELAVQQINELGGIDGTPVKLVQADEGSSSATAASAVQELLTDGNVDAIIGPASSKVALSVIPTLGQSGVVTCSPAVTTINLSKVPGQSRFFRTMPGDTLQAVALARAVAATGLGTAGVLIPDDDYGTAFAASLLPELQRQDVTVSDSIAYDPAADSQSGAVTQLLASKPDSVVVVGLPEAGGRILRELRNQGAPATTTPTFVSDGMRRPDLFEQVQPGTPTAVAGIHGTSPAAVPAVATWFTDAFAAYAPDSSAVYASYAYDCANLLALASLAAGTDDPTTFGDQMVAVSRNGLACRDYATCAPLVADDRNIDLNGASGPIDFTSQGDPTGALYDLFYFDDSGKDVLERQIVVGG
jgi:ABC-type branched-subunit amino acid transport system substrate-binding protein